MYCTCKTSSQVVFLIHTRNIGSRPPLHSSSVFFRCLLKTIHHSSLGQAFFFRWSWLNPCWIFWLYFGIDITLLLFFTPLLLAFFLFTNNGGKIQSQLSSSSLELTVIQGGEAPEDEDEEDY